MKNEEYLIKIDNIIADIDWAYRDYHVRPIDSIEKATTYTLKRGADAYLPEASTIPLKI